MRVAALSIAGSDSGGGAGIQADLRTLQRLGVFGTTAITAITAQNLDGVHDLEGTRPDLLAAQIDAALGGFPIAAIKTGMLWSTPLIEVVADRLRQTTAPLVVDPVMVATTGARLLDARAVEAYAALWPRASLVTPNLDEAAVLGGRAYVVSAMEAEAARLADQLGCPVLLKGGHLDDDPVDVLATGVGSPQVWRHRRVTDVNTHGSGCILSAAIAAHLALGHELADACAAGLSFVHDALARGAGGQPGLAAIEQAQVDPSHLERGAV